MSIRWPYGAIACAVLGLVSCNSSNTSHLADAPEDAPEIDAPAGPIITSFIATPPTIPAGDVIPLPITLTWAVEGSATLSIAGIGTVTGTTATGSATTATSFVLTATGSDGATSTATASVAVDTGALGIYVDAGSGDDRHPGQPDSPVKSVDRAAALVPVNESIFLAAGNYAAPTSFSGGGGVTIPNGVSIVPLANGVTFTGAPSNVAIVFAGSGSIQNVKIAAFTEGIIATTGNVAISGVQFTGVGDQDSGDAAINASGSAQVTVTPGGLTNYIVAPSNNFASVTGSAQLEIDGGAIDGIGPSQFSGVSALAAQGSAQLVLDGVTMDGNTVNAFEISGAAKVTVRDNSVINNTAGNNGAGVTVRIDGNPTFILDHSTISNSPSVGVSSQNATGAGPVITVQNGATITTSKLNGISSGVAAVSVLASHVDGNTIDGINMSAGALTTSAGSTISNNGGNGVNLRIGGVFQVVLRGTQIMANVKNGLLAQVDPTSTIDLGTATVAGANTFSGNNPSAAVDVANVAITTALVAASLVVTAIGDTWDVSVQQADANGHYATPLTLSTPPLVAGQNIFLQSSGPAADHLQLVLDQ